MKSCILIPASLFILAISCFGQTVNSGPYVVSQVLSNAHMSGSLSYWSRGACSSSNLLYPPAPALRGTKPSGGPPLQTLQEMFADDPKMQVTLEPGGIVRMFERDVPRDLLDVRIQHLSFEVSGPRALSGHGPNMAIRMILSTPEVKAFRSTHKIGPFSEMYLLPADADSDKPRVSGHLDDVTVSQALDYIFQTFPGFWIYGNCPSRGKGEERNVYFWFYENTPNP